MKKIKTSVLCSLALGLMVSGCADDGQTSSREQPGASSSQPPSSNDTVVEAGGAGLALGVSRWELSRSGSQAVIVAVGAAGQTVAQLNFDGESGAVESSAGDDGAPLVDALKNDLEESAGPRESAEGGEKAVRACYATFFACEDAGWYGFFQGWWTAWTCHRPFWPCASHLTALYTN